MKKLNWSPRFSGIAVLASFLLFASSAGATRIVREPLVWRHSSTEFAKLQVSSTFADTTQYFGVENWALPNFGTIAAAIDSLCIGQVVVQGDSSAAYTPNLTAFSVTLQSSADGSNWTTVWAPGTQTITSGVFALVVPLFIRTSAVSNAANLSRVPMPFLGSKLRLIVAGTTGSLNAARLFVMHYAD